MDFFARQDHARKKTKLLVFYFVVAVILIVALNYLVGVLGFDRRPGSASSATIRIMNRRRRWCFGIRQFFLVRP